MFIETTSLSESLHEVSRKSSRKSLYVASTRVGSNQAQDSKEESGIKTAVLLVLSSQHEQFLLKCWIYLFWG